jgi:hypothetical protein
VGTAPCFVVGTIADLFFAGFAATGKAASTHKELNVAKIQSAAAIGKLRSMAASPLERLWPD